MPSEDPTPKNVTGLPGLRTWRSVYLLVLGILAGWVWLLTLLPRLFA